MRMLKLAAAIGILTGSLGLSTIASAEQSRNRDIRIESQADYNRHVLGIPDGRNPNTRNIDRRDNRSDRWNDNPRSDQRDNNWRNRNSDRRDGYTKPKKCKTQWRDNRRVRVCK